MNDYRAARMALLTTDPYTMDAAWAAAESALPTGWRLRLTRSEDDYAIWEASAVSPAFFNGENDNDSDCMIGSGASPVEALTSLGKALRPTVGHE